jgi:hypothetical protein
MGEVYRAEETKLDRFELCPRLLLPAARSAAGFWSEAT